MPTVAHELVITLSKQQRFSDALLVAYRANGFPFDVAASDALHRLRSELVTLVRLCIEEKVRASIVDGVREPHDTLASMSHWLLARVDGMSTMLWADDALIIVKIVEQCEGVIDRPVERSYAGPCDTCGHDIFVEHGQPTIECAACGRVYDLQTRRDWLLHVVADRLATAPEIARALSSLSMPITHDLIRQWRHRGRLQPRAKDRRGVPLYRVGDVIDLLADRAREQHRRAVGGGA